MQGTRFLAVTALCTALTAVATAFLGVDLPNGYYHLGDGIYLAAALALGPAVGAVAGGLGGALADLVGGYAVWAPFTLAIKGLAGLAAGWLAGHGDGRGRLLALAAAGLITVVGYFGASALLYGAVAAAAELWGTTAQVLVGGAIAWVLTPVLARTARGDGGAIAGGC